MPAFMLCHEHLPTECASAFAAWRGHSSPLRHGTVLASCPLDGHRLYWRVEAADAPAALALLPPFVAARSVAVPVQELPVP